MKPFFTLIVVGKSIGECQIALNSTKNLSYKNFNILVSIGKNPSAQRNKASKSAKGDYLLFLDNDSEVDNSLLDRYIEIIEGKNFPDIIGGPAIYHSSSSFFKNSIKIISNSTFGFAFSRARYTPIGEIRKSDEKELILCNLCIKKEFFFQYRGFSPKLYPNEENEFLNRVQKSSVIYYHPLAIVRREAIGSFKEFALKFTRYGQGRAKHYINHPSHFKFIYILPSIMFIYVLTLPFLILNFHYAAIPLILYLILSSITSGFNCYTKPRRSIALTTAMFFIGHILYGVGFLSYFFKVKKSDSTVSDESIEIIEINP
jgi:GT2 family glycosyltransferase